MDSPWLSTSLRDFWSHRWNLPMKLNLYRVGYLPTVQGCRVISGINELEKTPKSFKMTGILFSFLVSGIVHEWMMACTSQKSTFEQFNFFLIHGILACGEPLVDSFRDYKNSKNTVRVLMTWIIFLMTSPLFINPWKREGILARIKPPLIIDLFIRG